MGKIMDCQGNNTTDMSVRDLMKARQQCNHLKIVDTTDGVLKIFQPTFEWIDRALENGHNVLIHCLAGAHRAGTTAIAYLMHKVKLDLRSAIISAKLCRPIIHPETLHSISAPVLRQESCFKMVHT
jgi:protein-tyrosine phosphatase